MKEKLQKDVFKIGSTKFDHKNFGAIETASITSVAIMAVTVGAIYGSLL